jgi:hypothetical protein
MIPSFDGKVADLFTQVKQIEITVSHPALVEKPIAAGVFVNAVIRKGQVWFRATA